MERINDLQDQLNTLLNSKPETGAQWAEIALIEKMLIEAKQEWHEENGQFGAGA
jgi:hypothetical protein